MHRLTPALLAATVLSLTFVGLTLAARVTQTEAATHAADQSGDLELFMSNSETGPRMHSFTSDTPRVYAIVAYSGAKNERYRVRVRDLGGIEVKTKDTPALSGDGRHAVEIVPGDFLASYQRRIGEAMAKLPGDVTANRANCAPARVPPVPNPWPPRNPDPEFEKWMRDTKNSVVSTQATTVDLTRTLQAMLMMPDVAGMQSLSSSLALGRDKLAAADKLLSAVPRTLEPSRPEQPRPPDPAGGCALILAAMDQLDLGIDAVNAAMAAMPTDTSGWHFGPTSARFDGAEFIGCLQYEVDVLEIKNNQPSANAAASTQWTLGSPGEPALIFPKPDQVDGRRAGALSISLPANAEAMYAQSVKAPGINHKATVSAFVTDAKCIPVNGATVTFAVDPATGGTLTPSSVPVVDGIAEAEMVSGNDAARGKVNAVLCVGDCASGKQVKASAGFNVIGPAKQISFKINPPKQLNRFATREDQRIALISVFAKDAFGQDVADGTTVTVQIESGPGTLAYNREKIVNGRPSGEIDPVTLGKRADLVIEDGVSKIVGTDPGYVYHDLYLTPGNEPNGKLTLVAEADGTRETMAYEITSKTFIYLPSTTRNYNIRVQMTTSPTPTRRPLLPTETNEPPSTATPMR
jgi:hypothetical protein